MAEDTLFPCDFQARAARPDAEGGAPRVQYPCRQQVELVPTDLDSTIADDHQVRSVWAYVEAADISKLYAKIRAVEGHAGRAPIDPRILLALWLQATLDGIGSARALERLCEEHAAYRWICGGVSVNYHTLADFRSDAGEILDQLLTDSVVRLQAAGLATLQRVSHDGLRVRASAGTDTFRRKETLERLRQEAQEQVDALRKELEEDPGASDRRRKAARERAARERKERVEQALGEYPEVREQKKNEKDQARVSTTDPDARKMRMADGGFRPAYNVQISVDTGSQAIVGIAVLKNGSDGGQLLPAVQQIEQRHGTTPPEVLADGGFASRGDIEQLSTQPNPCTVYSPPPELKTHKGVAIEPKADESAAVLAWRARMETEAAKELYKERAATVECVNAHVRNKGLQQFPVRGAVKVLAVALLHAVTHNMTRIMSLLGTG